MPAIHLVRHGQASFGAADYDRLSPLGLEQSRAAGAALRARGVTPAVVVHGALRRQRETAEALAAAWSDAPDGPPPLREDARWAEYDHEALLTALHRADGPPLDPPADPQAAFQDALERALRRWIAGEHEADYAESYRAYRARAAAGLEAAASGARPGPVVVVSSAGTIAAVVADLLGLDPEGWAALNRVAVNAGTSTVVAGRRGRSLVSFNEHGHVGGPGQPGRTTR